MIQLSLIETERLSTLELTIEHGLQTFVEVGNALAEIRDSKLYRATYGTFEEYCGQRWRMSRPRAYQLIDAAQIFKTVSTIVDTPPSNEAQIRPLVGLSTEQQLTVWPLVVDTAPNGKITAAHVQRTVDEYTQLEQEESTQDSHLNAALTDESKPVCQSCGLVYDGQLCPDCNPKPILEQVVTQVDGCKVIIGDAKRLDLTQFERYGVIVADPPWPYRITIKQGTTEGQYDSMTDEDLKSIPVPQLALPDSVLLLWGTWPKLPEALALMEAWGFDYVTGFPWVKTTSGNNLDYGVGYWVRGVSEYVLIGRRGSVSIEPLRMKGFMGLLAENDNGSPALWLGGPNLQHSRKPDSVHQIAEALPGPYLELFARRPRHGWTVFGNEQALLQRTLA